MSIPSDLLKWKSANLNPDDINFFFNQNDDIFLIILSKMRNSVTKIIISRCYYTLRAKLSLHMCSNQCKINQVFLKYDWELECPVYSSLSPYLVLYDHCRRRQNNCFYSNCEKYDKVVGFVCCVHCPFIYYRRCSHCYGINSYSIIILFDMQKYIMFLATSSARITYTFLISMSSI